MRSRRRHEIVAVVLLLMAAAACSNASVPMQGSMVPTSSGGPNGPKPTKTTASPGVEVPELLDFEATLIDGGTFHGVDVAGKDVAFWFWAPW
jgi:hypothetical protein